MDTSDENIKFTDQGCNHCESYHKNNIIDSNELDAYKKNIEVIKKIKGKYNCLIGVSGGLDSTYLLIHAVKDLKLRPLAVHIDNGWNTGLANKNIFNLLEVLKVDLETIVLDWNEFKKMQIAILSSGTPDLEAPTDLFINYTMRSVARKYNLKYILTGTNPQTEDIMGSNWSYGQRDPIYLKNLYYIYNKDQPKYLPFKNWYLSLYEQFRTQIVIVRPLKFIKYGKNIALKRSQNEVNWIEYPRKHGESFITRFYQNYFLTKRFGYDKRHAHYSALILNNDLTRSDALEAIKNNELNSIDLKADITYFINKLNISRRNFDLYCNMKKYSHHDYKTLKNTILFKTGKFLKKYISQNSIIYKYVKKIITS